MRPCTQLLPRWAIITLVGVQAIEVPFGKAALWQGGRVSTYQNVIDAKARLEEDERETWRLEFQQSTQPHGTNWELQRLWS